MFIKVRENTGWCDHCKERRLVRKPNTFFQPWRCSVCGSRYVEVGEKFTRQLETTYARGGAPIDNRRELIPTILVLFFGGIVVLIVAQAITHAIH